MRLCNRRCRAAAHRPRDSNGIPANGIDATSRETAHVTADVTIVLGTAEAGTRRAKNKPEVPATIDLNLQK